MLDDTGEDVFETGERINSEALAGATRVRGTAVVLPPSSPPKNPSCCDRTAAPRIARSTRRYRYTDECRLTLIN
jgi:hypothetical protein